MRKFDYSLQNNYKISVKEKSKISFIEINDILFLQCDGYLTTIYLIDKKNVRVSKLLKDFEEELCIYGFLRVNHNTLINTQHISNLQINKHKKTIHIKDVEIQISRRKFNFLKDFLEL